MPLSSSYFFIPQINLVLTNAQSRDRITAETAIAGIKICFQVWKFCQRTDANRKSLISSDVLLGVVVGGDTKALLPKMVTDFPLMGVYLFYSLWLCCVRLVFVYHIPQNVLAWAYEGG